MEEKLDVDVTPIRNPPSPSHYPITMRRSSDTVSNITRNDNSSIAKSDTCAQTDNSLSLPKLRSPDINHNQCDRITRQSLKKINDILLTPIKTSVRIAKRRQTIDVRALGANSSKRMRRQTVDVNPFGNEHFQTKTFKLNFPAYMNLAPLIYHGTQKKTDTKLPPAPPLNGNEINQKATKFEATKSSKRVLKVLENAGIPTHKATGKHKAPKPPKSKMNNGKIIKKPYKCSECGKCYRASFDLISHMSHHTGEPAFRCKLCEYSCLNIKTIKKHAVKVHNTVFSL